MTLFSAPSLSGNMFVSAPYNALGQGLTDRVFIIGHGDGLTLNDPYQVLNITDACNALNLDSNSPLVRTLLETYYGGCQDIWLVAAAPMSEYQPDPTLRDNAYYSTYYARLATTYSILTYWDSIQIMVIAEAPFYDAKGIDFATQLTTHCESSFELTGSIRLGLLGTRMGSPLSQADVDNMISDSRLGTFGSGGKFVAVIVGEGSYNFPEMPTAYTASAIGGVAANMATADLRTSMVYTRLSNMVASTGAFTPLQLSNLAEAQLNPITVTTKGRRGTPFQVVPVTDNTLAAPGSDFWSMGQTRLVMAIVDQLVVYGKRYMGTIGYVQFQKDCIDFMNGLQSNNYLQSYTLDIGRDTVDTTSIYVTVTLTPYIDLRQITFTTTIGP